MELDTVTIKLGAPLRQAALRIAESRDISVGQLMRDLLAKEISRDLNAKPPVRVDERLVAPLRARLASDLAHAQNWDDLQTRLRQKGYILRIAGGGLALHDWPDDRRICKASELGFSYSRLMRRFSAPFPNHPHRWLTERMLPPVQDDTGDVFEPFD